MTAESDQAPRASLMLLNPESQLRQRLGATALINYVEVLKREVTAYFQQHLSELDCEVQLGIALFPQRGPLIEVQCQPPLEQTDAAELGARLLNVEAPAVWNGAVAFSIRQVMGAGWAGDEPGFQFPFVTICPPRTVGNADEAVYETLDSFLQRCVAAQQPSQGTQRRGVMQSVIQRLQRWLPAKWTQRLLAERPSPTPAPAVAVADDLPPLPDEPEEDITIPDDAPTPLDQINQMIQSFPNDVRYVWRRILYHMANTDHVNVTHDCRLALQLQPDDPWTMANLAYSLRAQNDSAEALRVLGSLIQTHPRLIEGYVRRSEIYAEIGAYDAMFADLEQALRVSPRSTALLSRHARACSALGRIDDAYRDLHVLQRLDPHDARTFSLRAYIRRQSSGDPETEDENRSLALADVERALKLDPNCATAFAIRAEIHIATGQLEAAIADCDRAIECDPELTDAVAFRGLARFRQQQFAEAAADLTAAIERGCLLNFVRPLLAEAQHFQGDHEAAIATLDVILEHTPDDPQVLMHKAVLLLMTDRPQESLELLNQIIEQDPNLAPVYAERGKAHRALGEFDEALEDFNQALKLGATDPFVRMNHALSLFDMQRYDEALDGFTAGLKEFPDSAQGHFYRGCTLRALQRDEEALGDFNEALRLDPDNHDVYFQRGMAYLNLERPQEAIQEFTELIERTSHEMAYVSRAHARIRAGQLDLADEDFQEAIQLSPGETENYRIQQILAEAQYHHQREAYDEAIARAGDALEMDEQCIPALLIRAGSHWYGNQLVEAVNDYTEVMEIEGPTATSLNGRGQVYSELGEYELSLEDLDQALTMCEEHDSRLQAYIQNGRGLALTGLQRYHEAAAAFEESILNCPANAWVHYNHGLMYQAQGQTPSAIPCFQLALRVSEPPLRARQRARALGFLNRQEAT